MFREFVGLLRVFREPEEIPNENHRTILMSGQENFGLKSHVEYWTFLILDFYINGMLIYPDHRFVDTGT